MKKMFAFLSIFFLLIISSVAVSAANVNPESMSLTITHDIPSSVTEGEPFTISASATSTVAYVSIYLYRDSFNPDNLLTSDQCLAKTCSLSYDEQINDTGTYIYYVKAIEAGTQLFKFSSGTVTVLADSEDPTFSNFGEDPTDPATYAPDATYTFTVDVTDNIGIESVSFEFNGVIYVPINVGGDTWEVTVTDLAADDVPYDYMWSAIDVNGNEENSDVQTYTVNRADSTATITISPSTSEEYGTETTATCTIDNAEQAGLEQLFRSDIGAVENPDIVTLDVDTYTYSCTVDQTQNYTEETATTQDLTITKATPVLSLTLDDGTGPVPGDISVEYGTQTTALGTVVTGDAGATLTLTRSDVGVVDFGTTSPLTDVDTLDVGTYVYTFDYAGSDNYNADSVSVTLTVTRINPDLQCTIDPAIQNTVPNPTTVTCTINNDEQTVVIERDGNPVTNGTQMFLPAGTYQFSASVAQSTNYEADTWGPVTYEVLEEDEAPQYYNEFVNPASGVTYLPGADYTFSIDWIDNIGVDTVTFTFDGTDYVPVQSGDTYTVTLTDLNAGNYTYEWSASDAAGNTNQTGQLSYEIVLAQPVGEIHLTLDDGTGAVESNLAVIVGTETTAIGWTTLPEGTLVLLRDGINVGALTETITLPAGTYNYTLVYSGATNYADASITYFLSVSDTIPPIITITNPVDYTSSDTTLDVTTNEVTTCYYGTLSNSTQIMDVTDGMTHTTPLTDLPLGNNTYYVRCVDQFGNEAEASVTWEVVSEFNITLEMGWNLISLPLIPVEPVLTSDTSIWGTGYTIQHYDTASDTWLEYVDGVGGTLTEVVPDLGYWVYADTARNITILGDEPGQRSVELLPGINMVGWTSLEAMRMDLALWHIQENVSLVQTQNMSDITQKLLREADIGAESFETGKGYFITVTNLSIWEYPENTPPVADAGSDKTTYVGNSVTLDGSGSYDVDGSIVSYSWAVGGTTKTGVKPSFRFDSTGTYIITLTVTDDDGATDIDTVRVTVNAYGGGGGGGPGGTFVPTGAIISLEIVAPESITVTQGTPYTFTAIVKNTGHANVYDVIINSDPEWITVSPESLEELEDGETYSFEVTVTLPTGSLETNYMTLTASGSHPNATVESGEITIEIIGNPEQCEQCDQASGWSACVNGTQTRTVYTCDEGTNYNCIETVETRNCGGMMGYFLYVTDNPLVSGIAALIIIGAIGGIWYAHKKGKTKTFVKSVKEVFKFKKASTGKPADKKPQGIDFSIQYKKNADLGGGVPGI